MPLYRHLAASATTDTTNASNISTGTLAAARGGAGTVSGALKGNGSGIVSGAATSDLSDVSSGTWTPTDASGGGLTLTVTDATWYKVGKIAIITGHIVWPSTADTHAAAIGGVPVNCAAASTTSNYVAGGSPALTNFSNPLTLAFQTGGQTIFPFAAGGSTPTNAGLSGLTLSFTIVYRTS